MKRFRSRGGADLERELRAARPQPREQLVRALAARVQSGTRFPSRTRGYRVALGGAVTALFLAALLPAGGLGYASGAVSRATSAVKDTVVAVSKPDSQHASTVARSARAYSGRAVQVHKISVHTTSGQHQYGTPICHRTHSAKNPWVLIRVSDEALPAHAAHGDIIPAPPGGCPTH